MKNAERQRAVPMKAFPESPGYTVAFGERSNEVILIQVMLDTLKLFYDGFDGVTVGGFFDEATEKAVSDFQRISGIDETGRVDVITWNAIATEYNNTVYEDG